MTAAQSANYEAAIRSLGRLFPGAMDPEWLERTKANYKMQYEYPDLYVAYLDHWADGPSGRMLSREVLAHGRSYPETWQAVAGHPQAGRIECHLFEDPDGPLDDLIPELADDDDDPVVGDN